jgi:hypothetical protein
MSYVDLAAVGKNRLVAGGQLRNSSGHPEGGTVETLFFNVVGRLLRPARAVAGPDAMLGAAALGLRPDGSGLLLAGDAFDGSETGIAGAFLLPDGTAAGDLLGVNRVAAGIQEAPDVAALGDAWSTTTAVRSETTSGSARARGSITSRRRWPRSATTRRWWSGRAAAPAA